jgi:hypothetical protein
MTAWIPIAAVAVAVIAAARSTWSPCGLSMLASITPLSEVGRGHRYRTTALWFVVGSTVGGATLGVIVALLTVVANALSFTPRELILVALGASALAIASDTNLKGIQLPVHHRQVNERWLDRFRPWVYGAGFGWQIGTGLATYIITAGLYLMIVLAVLTGEPWFGLVVGVLFGLVRGLSVFLSRHITNTDTLRTFHVRFHRLGPRVRRCMVTVEGLATVIFAWLLTPWAGFTLLAVSCVCVVASTARRRGHPQPTTATELRREGSRVSRNE